MEKVALARFVHTSTEMGRRTLLERGAAPDKVVVIRRGLDVFPDMKPLRTPRRPLQLVCIARLVPKKGLRRQLKVHAALRDAGIAFAVRIVGEGELRGELERETAALGLTEHVTFTGQVPPDAVWEHLRWADVLLHTGVVAVTGDRDGLPNVIPEAMVVGALVLTSPTAATTEAIEHEVTGLVADVNQPDAWVAALRRLAEDDALAERLRAAARRWTEENYDAHRNAARLHACFRRAIAGEGVAPGAREAAAPRP